MSEPTKIVLLTGYLGAGKTTLLNRILANDLGIRAAVIVNDIGEVNVDARLVRDGGLTQGDEVIPLTNGCICCTLSDDLAAQLSAIAASDNFDYIIIEASGICEPIPIAYTISSFCGQNGEDVAPLKLDNIVSVVDCARMYDEFNGGKDLLANDLDADDVESLLIQQIEFCSTLVLNKVDLVTPEQLAELKALVRGLQQDAQIIEATSANVPLEDILNTDRFDYQRVYNSATWIQATKDHHGHGHAHDHDSHDHDATCDHEHDHDHDHEHGDQCGCGHHHEEGELEYGIATFVYMRRRPFDLEKLGAFASNWPREIIRAKGTLWAAQDPDMHYVFEQAGRQISVTEMGKFLAALDSEEQERVLAMDADMRALWDPELGDRMNRICFIGRHMNQEEIEANLDACLV